MVRLLRQPSLSRASADLSLGKSLGTKLPDRRLYSRLYNSQMRMRVLDWELDTRTKAVTGPGGLIEPRRQVYEVFLLLLQRAPSLVTKEDLVASVWNGRSVSDSTIAQVIRELRALLGDDPSTPGVIATRHRQGYQCIAKVEILDDRDLPPVRKEPLPRAEQEEGEVEAPALSSAARSPTPEASPLWKGWRLPALTLSLIGLTFSAFFLQQAQHIPEAQSELGWPTDPRAAKDLADGLLASRRLESAEALKALEAAAKIEDTPRLSAHRSRLLLHLGRDGEANALADRLAKQQPRLGRAEQLLIEALGRELKGRHREAAQTYSVLSEMHPEDIDFALIRWESSLQEGLRDVEGEEMEISHLLASPLVPVERRLLLAAQHAGLTHNRREQLSRADSALLTGGNSAPVIVALARLERSAALTVLGQRAGYLDEIRLALEVLLGRGEVLHAMRALRVAVATLNEPSEAPGLATLLETFTEYQGDLQDPRMRAELSLSHGRQLDLRGDHAGAAETLLRTARDFDQLGSPRALEARRALAEALLSLGKPRRAREILVEALSSTGAPEGGELPGAVYASLAKASEVLGMSEQATAEYELSLRQHRLRRNLLGEVLVLSEFSAHCLRRGDLPRAGELLRQALPLADRVGAEEIAAGIRLQQARLALRLGDLASSWKLALQSIATLEDLGAKRRAAEAQLLLSRLARYRADLGQAETRLRRLAAERNGRDDLRLRQATEEGYLNWEMGRPGEARDSIREFSLFAEADAPGWPHLELRILAAKLDIDSGRTAAAEQDLRAYLASELSESRFQPAPHQWASVHLQLGEALIAQDELNQARKELETARARLLDSPDALTRLSLDLAETRLDLAREARKESSRPDHSLQRLQWIADQAEEQGALLLAFEARVERLRDGRGGPRESKALARDLADRHLLRLLRLLAPNA